MKNIWILAQSENEQVSTVESTPIDEKEQETTAIVRTDSNTAGKEGSSKGIFDNYGSLIFIIFMFVLMYFLLFRGPRKRQQEHKQMVQSLRKNDKVRTIGGIIGTVVDIKDDEITMKIDESSNTKMKVIPSAIGRNLSQEKNQ